MTYFYRTERYVLKGKRVFQGCSILICFKRTARFSRDVKDPETDEVLVKKGRIFTQRAIRQLKTTDANGNPRQHRRGAG